MNHSRNTGMGGGYSQGYQGRPQSDWGQGAPPVQPNYGGYGQPGAPPAQYNMPQASYGGYPPHRPSGGYAANWGPSAGNQGQQGTQGGGYDYYSQQNPQQPQDDNTAYNYNQQPTFVNGQQGQGYAHNAYGGGYQTQPAYGQPQSGYEQQQQGYNSGTCGSVVANSAQEGQNGAYDAQANGSQALPSSQQGYSTNQQLTAASYASQGAAPQPNNSAPPSSGYAGQPGPRPSYGQSYGTPQGHQPLSNPPAYVQPQQQSPNARGGYAQAGYTLCGDLIREILIKLPVKSLLRFKQVSKTWLHMITSNSFIFSHYSAAQNRQSAPSFFIVRNAMGGYRIVSYITQISMESSKMDQDRYLPFLLKNCEEMWESQQLFSAGFGLYCIFEWITQRVTLWNPETRKLGVLPPCPFHDASHPDFKVTFFFGHFEYKDDEFSYKVGILCTDVHTLHLYSSSIDSWKVILTPKGSKFYYLIGDGVNLNGKYHILCVGKKWGEDDNHIMTFDYSSEEFGRIEVPDLSQINGRCNLMYTSFLTSDDDILLCLVIRWTNKQVIHEEFLDLWTMHEYGVKESWSKECTVGPIGRNMKVLGYSKSAGGFFLQNYFDSKLYLYKCVSCAADERIILVNLDHVLDFRVFDRTVKSLVPIKGSQNRF